MDGQRFDDLARRLSLGLTRRQALTALGGLMAALAGMRQAPAGAARTCVAPESPCGNRCRNPQTDPRNCGGCGVRCPRGATCQSGICACPNGGDVCNGRCVEILTDRRNCGGCGIRCPQGGECDDGACLCPVGEANCNGRCVNLQTDRNNCGDCGNRCLPGKICRTGVCSCFEGLENCAEACKDLQTDPENCGACANACPAGIDCLDGACACPDGQIACGGSCVDPLFDNANCGGCGIACESDELCTVCNQGVCDPLCGLGTCPETCRGICDPCVSAPGIRRCEFDSDCRSGNCNGFNCEFAASCVNGVHDGSETGVDCGGGVCPGCDGDECESGRDCASGVCNESNCQAPSCLDDVRNGSESDVDCGGADCPPCADGRVCRDDDDCESGNCNPNSICGQDSCDDELRNGLETDIDCGGPDCPPCANDLDCLVDDDCESGFCNPFAGNVCRTPTCDDTVTNGQETDLDCGGPECPPCEDSFACLVDDDCESGFCDPNSGNVCRSLDTNPNPECAGQDPCDLVSCGGDCICGTTVEGGGACVRFETSPPPCTTSRDCSIGLLCGPAPCLGSGNFCGTLC